MNAEELLTAAARGDTAGVRDALQAGTPPETRDSRGRTALLIAAAADHVEAAEVLVKAGADPDARDHGGDTAFLVAAATGSVAMLHALLLARGPSHDPSRTGTALVRASERGHAAYVRELLKTATDAGESMRRALTAAAARCDHSPAHAEIVDLLIRAGADER